MKHKHPNSKIGVAGSDLYYCTLALPNKQKQALFALYQYWQTLWRISDHVKSPEAAQLKLNWWRQELNNIFKQKSQHPVGQALAVAIDHYALPHSLFYQPIDATEVCLSAPNFPNQSALETHYQQLAGNLHIANCLVLNGDVDQATTHYALKSSISLEIIRHISLFVLHFQHQQCYLPQSELNQIDPQTLATFANSKHHRPDRKQKTIIAELINTQFKRAEQYYQTALSELPAEKYRSLKTHRLYLYLQHKQGQLINKHSKDIFNYQIDLSPLRRAWLTTWFR